MNLSYVVIPLIGVIEIVSGNLIIARGAPWYEKLAVSGWKPSVRFLSWVRAVHLSFNTVSALITWNLVSDNRFDFWFIFSFFIIKIFLFLLWSYIIFGVHRTFLAVFVGLLLCVSELSLIVIIFPFSYIAAALLLPSLVWAISATSLTFSVWSSELRR